MYSSNIVNKKYAKVLFVVGTDYDYNDNLEYGNDTDMKRKVVNEDYLMERKRKNFAIEEQCRIDNEKRTAEIKAIEENRICIKFIAK